MGPDIGIIGATISPQSESMASPLVLLTISYYRHHHRPTCCTRSSDTDGTVDGLLPDNRTSHLQGLGIEDGSHHGKGLDTTHHHQTSATIGGGWTCRAQPIETIDMPPAVVKGGLHLLASDI